MITAIYIAAEQRGLAQPADVARLVQHQGIVGDRHFGKTAYPGQNITFVAAEEIANFNSRYGLNIGWQNMRRNIITQGDDLNSLVGKTFTVGDVVFYGVELCEPCATLGSDLATAQLPASAVVKALVGRAGLRADVLNSGEIKIGMALCL